MIEESKSSGTKLKKKLKAASVANLIKGLCWKDLTFLPSKIRFTFFYQQHNFKGKETYFA